MDSRDNIDFRCQRTDLGKLTAVGTLVILEDHLADGLLFILVNSIPEVGKIRLVIR
jgi:hypothetical protein